jgi:hypothetical protein
VKAGSTAVKTGQVNFCDASGKYCVDIHLLGTAQLTSAGTAVLKFRPGIGSHSYKAVFVGTKSDAANSSSAAALAVTGATGKYPTTTAIAQRGNIDNYTLTATVTGLAKVTSSAASVKSGTLVTFTATLTGSGAKPTGTVAFLDGTTQLGTGTLNGSGVATYPTGKLAVGTHKIKASYGGDGNYVAANSAAISVTVTAQ